MTNVHVLIDAQCTYSTGRNLSLLLLCLSYPQDGYEESLRHTDSAVYSTCHVIHHLQGGTGVSWKKSHLKDERLNKSAHKFHEIFPKSVHLKIIIQGYIDSSIEFKKCFYFHILTYLALTHWAESCSICVIRSTAQRVGTFNAAVACPT